MPPKWPARAMLRMSSTSRRLNSITCRWMWSATVRPVSLHLHQSRADKHGLREKFCARHLWQGGRWQPCSYPSLVSVRAPGAHAMCTWRVHLGHEARCLRCSSVCARGVHAGHMNGAWVHQCVSSVAPAANSQVSPRMLRVGKCRVCRVCVALCVCERERERRERERERER